MPYKLSDGQIHELIAQPETGMGYQYVETTTRIYSSLKGVVLNGEVFIPENKIEKIIGGRAIEYSAILNEAEQPGYIRAIRVINKNLIQLGEIKNFAKSNRSPASQSPISLTEKYEIFKRFSAYKNDRRITSDMGLLPGTYATTEADARNVKTGFEATLRYALPSDESAVYVFTIQPPEKTPVREGIVEPANGKPGGGVEVLFENGSPSKTVTSLTVISSY